MRRVINAIRNYICPGCGTSVGQANAYCSACLSGSGR